MKKRVSTRKRRDPNVYPPGWDYRRVNDIAEYYDALKDQPALDEAHTAGPAIGLVWMEVPQELVPDVRKLIARHRKSA